MHNDFLKLTGLVSGVLAVKIIEVEVEGVVLRHG